jgi:hypothetical protein|tara:strand:+ start:132 stop:716 length:585 start_codon:yes stop_codon:yes gene_type:complete
MMQTTYFFPTLLWSKKVDFDNDLLAKEIYEYSKSQPNQSLSNVGGYQGDLFHNQNWVDMVANNCPQWEDEPLKNLIIYPWCNINQKGAYNIRHMHYDRNLLLSGVYYVKVPKNSGTIRFWDPRGPLIYAQKDNEYFNDSTSSQHIFPKPGLLLFFPTWLEHDVTPNESEEDRISIAFNVKASFILEEKRITVDS